MDAATVVACGSMHLVEGWQLSSGLNAEDLICIQQFIYEKLFYKMLTNAEKILINHVMCQIKSCHSQTSTRTRSLCDHIMQWNPPPTHPPHTNF